ncbi:adenosine deaminase [Longispora albida]|uniref:adenosine deaminase n=1 Tax=Longispora albida TaxID=203523 RepID=UPI00036440CA|nr:adenosine deaminase [Longispora albida]
MRDLVQLPKAHLHVHLESAVRRSTVRELAGTEIDEGPYGTFAEFAAQRALIRDALRTPEHFRRVALEFCADEAAQGVRYAEVTFTAAAHEERLGEPGMPLAAVLEGLAEGQRAYGIDTRVILDHSRRRPVSRFARTLELALAHPEVVAIGLAGDEAYPLAPFAGVIRAADEAGVRLVHHAGETGGPGNIREAIRTGLAARIGHGVRVLDDPELVTEVRDLRVPLEVCPRSNVLLHVVGSLAEHPLPRLVEAGLAVTVNTDGEGALAAEYTMIQETFGTSDAELAALAVTTVDASFAPEAVKAELRSGIARWAA